MTSVNLILSYATRHPIVSVADLVAEFGMNPATARQLLSRLTVSGQLSRIAYGKYTLADRRQDFPIPLTDKVRDIYGKLHCELPLVDFCVYSGNIFQPIQHHVSVNNAVYVETNRDTVETVFSRLKEYYDNVYCQPDDKFMADYIDLSKECIIVKPLVTESPLKTVEGVPSPSIEKLLVDIAKDPDFDYLHGAEYDYMLENTINNYRVSTSKILRYARRRGLHDFIKSKL